jgi:hypothetical protein
VHIPTPTEQINTELAQRLGRMREVYKELTSSPEALDCLTLVMAIATSRSTPDADPTIPLWLLLVGPPSTGKTTTVNFLLGRDGKQTQRCFPLATLTPASFASAYAPSSGTKVKPLLDVVNERCLLIKDLTTMLTQKADKVRELLGMLLSIYDGNFEKATGTMDVIVIKSRFSMLGCITSGALEDHQRYMSLIGGRFLMYQMPMPTQQEIDSGFNLAMQSQTVRQEAQQTLHDLVAKQLDQAETVKTPVAVGAQATQILKGLALLVARGRGTVTRGEVQIENLQRLFRQMLNLVRSIARVSGHSCIESNDLKLVHQVAVGSLPVQRVKVLQRLAQVPSGLTVKDVQKATKLEESQSRAHLKELCALGILEETKRPKNIGRTPGMYVATSDVTDLLNRIGENIV